MELQHTKLSTEAMGALMMCLQKCILEQTDIVPLLKDLKFSNVNGELYVLNPPLVKFENTFEEPDYSGMKMKDLRDMARQYNIKGFSKMKKVELISALNNKNFF